VTALFSLFIIQTHFFFENDTKRRRSFPSCLPVEIFENEDFRIRRSRVISRPANVHETSTNPT
jgi:hypothetical protein